jgi:hypothetical protein
MAEKPKSMKELSRGARTRAEEALKERELEVLRTTSTDLGSLRPRVGDKESFDKLVNAVQQSTVANESVAQLQDRVRKLGKKVVEVAKQVASLVT